MIKIESLEHRINGQQILHDIHLQIPGQGITVLVGANGAGKSTLLSLIARLQPLQQGSIEVDNMPVNKCDTKALAKKLAILRQNPHIASRISVRELLMFGRYPHHQGRPAAADVTAVEDALEQFELAPLANRYMESLSGGQRQRALVAMVFCQGTDYILLDEPLNNLDMYYARHLMQLIRQMTHDNAIAGQQKKSVVIVLHDINQAAAYADYIVAMKNGRIIAFDKTNALLNTETLHQVFGYQMPVIEAMGSKVVLHHL